ncbi:hypothetical protein N6H05_14600 [Sphingobium sp. WTD-1]|uniref:hypothetical protein n=1 Tax=Sphingobium sp. WTD-1 TaxID=2979467 RepID=UPI0024DE529B|nr:hypothetical protein [Sphingobium sp. WTD-1]WIA54293.1 hypothetical protein N6H05_14600 [Sphingobium sp. WTD-1]
MSLGKAILSIAKFALKKIVKPAAEEYGPDILADVVRRRSSGDEASDPHRNPSDRREPFGNSE